MITIKNEKQIEKMRVVNKIVANAHEYMLQFIKPGVSTMYLDTLAEEFILKAGAKPNFKNYNGYPYASCISLNDVVVHGMPSDKIILEEGDIVSIDLGAVKDGFHGDAARSWGVGKISKNRQRLMEVCEESFFKGIEFATAGCKLGDISSAIQNHVESNGFFIAKAMCGHGIGKKLHEDPNIPNFGIQGTGVRLQSGFTFAIEPMINVGTTELKFDADGWTCRTKDGSDSAHYENTIVITDGKPEILTLF